MSDVLKDAQRLYNESLDAQRDQRRQIEEDIAFSDPSDPQQWDAAVKISRENDPGGKRPCLVMDQTGQYVQQIAGQIEQQTPSIHAIPIGGGADKKAAEQIDGRVRHIEYASRASQHYTRALTSAARTGVGYILIRPEYVDRALGWQEPRISSEPDPLKVVFDPWSIETDGSDADFGFLLSPVSLREFERRWPKADKVDFGSTDSQRKDENRKSILVAEQWFKEQRTQTCVVYTGADGEETSGDEEEYQEDCQKAGFELPRIRNYTDKVTKVRWRRMSGGEILEEIKNPDGSVGDYPADSIGIVPVYGYVSFVSGVMKYCGVPRRARYPQQAYNFHISEQLAYIGTAPRSPWLVSKRAAAGVEGIWDRASQQSRAWLPYNDIDEEGAIAQPSRINAAANLVNHEAGAERALRDIEAAVAMYRANLGAPSNETSGVAIDARKQQGEAGNAHFPAHLAASLGQVGKIVLQMDARLADVRREQPIIGIDGTPGKINVDPEQTEAFERSPDGASINPNVGEYGVRVVIGASYSTQRAQTNAAFGEIMRGNSGLAQVVAPFWAQTLDFPGSDKFAQAMAAMAPPPVKAILQPEGHEDGAGDPAQQAAAMAQLQQQMQMLQQQLQEAVQHAHAAQNDADEAHALLDQAKQANEVKEQELGIKAYDAETKRMQALGATAGQAEEVVRNLIQQMLEHPDPLPGEPDLSAYTPQQPEPEPEPEPMEQQTDPHIQQLIDSHGQLADAVGRLIKLQSRPRHRVPIRDEQGNITRVIDQLAPEEGEPQEP